jgi:hypothetical protein
LPSFGFVLCVALAGCQLAVDFDRSLLADGGAGDGTGGVGGSGASGGVGGTSGTDGAGGTGGG